MSNTKQTEKQEEKPKTYQEKVIDLRDALKALGAVEIIAALAPLGGEIVAERGDHDCQQPLDPNGHWFAFRMPRDAFKDIPDDLQALCSVVMV